MSLPTFALTAALALPASPTSAAPTSSTAGGSTATAPSVAKAKTKPALRPARRPRLWIWFDDDGTPVVSDRRDSADAEPYRIGTFEEILLRQQGAPHSGFVDVVAPNVPPDVLALADTAARKYSVDKALVLAVIGVESGYRSGLVSRAGARGLMQLMPETAADLQVDPDVDAENVDGGTRFLAGLLRYFDDDRLAVAAYNAGPGRVKRAGNTVPAIPETIAYVDAVLSLRDAFVERGW